ncbi:hypothetical protein M1B72_09000 [Geomonas paludis]|uniref:Polysaccharide deacetylase n=1 Tax=Geomonas paludis TaxID=2740185 RepID=A0ABY4LIZ1_9BACT|nr:hypothetical protein [Geomonas paludis]UPU37827.1 hypothetical protein M1B72_09000 [Geomonas paludis]
MEKPSKQKQTLACLIIDDPLLRPRYGCLDYQKLLDEMKAHNFFTEIAFIPGNYQRSDPRTIRLFADNADRYSICVHGCNHTGNEFGGYDYHHLCRLSCTALARMEQHKRLTGLPYDRVIVFPQGRFSSVAMQAVKDTGYVAAFNSTIRAIDGKGPPAQEHQRPATKHYHDFPLFLRRYATDKSGFLADIAAGRPILIVDHHSAFRNGYRHLTDFIDWINSQGNIRWTSLSKVAEYYLEEPAATMPPMNFTDAQLPMDLPVALRRFLCEARDNYIERSNLLAKAYNMLRSP